LSWKICVAFRVRFCSKYWQAYPRSMGFTTIVAEVVVFLEAYELCGDQFKLPKLMWADTSCYHGRAVRTCRVRPH
jgi:hypothetical protein